MKVLFFLLISLSLFGQNALKGEIIYNVYRTVEESYSSENSKKVEQILAGAQLDDSENSLILYFSKQESLSHIARKMDNDGDKWAVFRNSLIGASGLFYYNLSEKVLLNQQDALGEKFLIRYNDVNANWTLVSETKKIGKYNCRKAIKITKEKGWKKTITKKHTAWYTPELPIPFGPLVNVGLPGLIMEVTVTGGHQAYTIRAAEIILNPEKNIDIKRPKKGRQVSYEEFQELNNKALNDILKKAN